MKCEIDQGTPKLANILFNLKNLKRHECNVVANLNAADLPLPPTTTILGWLIKVWWYGLRSVLIEEGRSGLTIGHHVNKPRASQTATSEKKKPFSKPLKGSIWIDYWSWVRCYNRFCGWGMQFDQGQQRREGKYTCSKIWNISGPSFFFLCVSPLLLSLFPIHLGHRPLLPSPPQPNRCLAHQASLGYLLHFSN